MPGVIVIGASEGGLEALTMLAAAMPPEFPVAIFVVLHIGAFESELPALLNSAGPLPASYAKDGEPIRPGHIYVAPPDHHVLVEHGVMRINRGPRENWARPAIDPLFRSAAAAYGSGVIGVILTGGLNDGTAGLFEIKRCGGTAIVQDPDGATNPSMPRSALRHVAVDHCPALGDLPALLVKLAEAAIFTDGEDAARDRRDEVTDDYTLADPIAITCPDCGGALRRTELGTLTQFRCHTGHVYTAEVMVAAQFNALEWSLVAAMRALAERRELCRQMAEKCATTGEGAAAAQWTEAMEEAHHRANALRELLETEWKHPGNAG